MYIHFSTTLHVYIYIYMYTRMTSPSYPNSTTRFTAFIPMKCPSPCRARLSQGLEAFPTECKKYPLVICYIAIGKPLENH